MKNIKKKDLSNIKKKDLSNLVLKKLKNLPPSMKNKKRYIAIKLEVEESLSRNEFVKGIWNNAISLIGDYGVAKTGLWVHDFDGKFAIIECNHKKTKKISSILSAIYEIENKKVRIDKLGESGTIKKLKKKFIQKE
ncbi:hypothetical protein C9439_05535 [archaeon SCG-AAA382B04]|nr:hypothetical protein C9439_05535 [archaeon SCG-AAA382B04]